MHSWAYHEALGIFSVAWSALAQCANRKRGCGTAGEGLMGSRAHTSRAWEYGRNMLKKGQGYRRLGDIPLQFHVMGLRFLLSLSNLDGSLFSIEPPIVPRFLTCGSPIPSAKSHKEEIVLCTCLDSATSTCFVVAPIFKLLLLDLIPVSSLIFFISITSE